MRFIALTSALLGVFILYLSFLDEPAPLSAERVENSFVSIEGVVSGERRLFGNTRLLTLNGTEVVCICDRSYLGAHVFIEGVVEISRNRTQIRAHSILVRDTPFP